MFGKRVSIVPVIAAVAALSLTGCPSVMKNTVKGLDINPSMMASVTIADLEVSEKKVMGVSKGKLMPPLITEKGIIQAAIADAVQKHEGADVLVGITVFTEQKKRDMTVTVTGYPARYKNFRGYEPWKEDQRPDKLIVKVNKREGGRDGGPKDRAGRPDAPVINHAPAAAPSEE